MKKRNITILKNFQGQPDPTGEEQTDIFVENGTFKGQIAPGVSTDELSTDRFKIETHITIYARGFYNIRAEDRIRLYEKDNTFQDWMIEGHPQRWDSQLFPTRKWTVIVCKRVEG